MVIQRVSKKSKCIVAMLFATVFCGLIVGTSTVLADDAATSTASITVATSCRMSAVVDEPHTATLTGGLYVDEIGKTTITTLCNDANGYAVYAIGYTNTEFGRNDMLGTNTGRTIATGTATLGNTSNWAMKLTAVSGDFEPTIESDDDGSFADYHAVPENFEKVADYLSVTDDSIGSQMETTYAAYIASAQAADVYTGKVKYTLVHPSDSTETPCAEKYTIIYNANGGSGNMDSQEACVDKAISLLPNGFTSPEPASEYTFVLWNTEPDGSGHFYHARQSVTNLASAGGSITLYAMWAPKYMQDLTAEMCSMVALEDPLTVYDRRDGSDYTVRYIAGACWMTQNLRIKGVINQEYSDFTRVENFDSCVSDLTSGDDYTEPRCHDSGNTTNGVWYNYSAATAGQIVGNTNSADVTQSICPKNWKLPLRSSGKVPGSIDSLLSSVTVFSPVAGGYYHDGAVVSGTSGYGYWWSTLKYDGYSRYYLRWSSGNLYASSHDHRSYGIYVRCMRLP